ncbi:MAG: MATE family efflux transporter [Phycisphaeraceae bacterium]|nr:MATE family efflux transporter [Phycisphaeraceae bacterium]
MSGEGMPPPGREGREGGSNHAEAGQTTGGSGGSAPVVVGARSAVRDLLVIAAPTIATMTSYTLMQFIDKLMVSRIGPEPIYVGAQGNGGLAAFVLIAIAMGVLTVINTYVAQNLGAGKPERAPAYAWAGIWTGLAFWVAVLVPVAFVLPWIFEAIRPSSITEAGGEALALVVERDRLAGTYGRILMFGAALTLCTRAISQYFYGMHRPGVVLIATVLGNVANLFFNALLIYGPRVPAWRDTPVDAMLEAVSSVTAPVAGALGIPEMGIAGAAFGTLLATLLELGIPLAVFLSAKYQRRYRTRDSWRPSVPHVRDLLRIGWPAGLMFGNEMICWAFFMVYLVGKFGSENSTAGWIAHQWMTLSFMPAVGLSIAITATVGKCLGAGRPDLAAHRAWAGLGLALGYMGLCAVCFVVFRRPMVELFIEPQTPEETRALLITLGGKFLILTAAFQVFDAVAMTLSGALRGAGDTVWVGVVTLALSWTVIVGGGLALVEFVPGLGAVGPWVAAAVYIAVLSLAILARFLSGKWKTMELLKKSEGGGVGAGVSADGETARPSVLSQVPVEPVDGMVGAFGPESR